MYPCAKFQSVQKTSDFETKISPKKMTDKNFEKNKF